MDECFRQFAGLFTGANHVHVEYREDLRMARERLADGAPALEVVSDRREDGCELFVIYLGGKETKYAERRHLRLK